MLIKKSYHTVFGVWILIIRFPTVFNDSNIMGSNFKEKNFVPKKSSFNSFECPFYSFSLFSFF
jgi:hypothetical protein